MAIYGYFDESGHPVDPRVSVFLLGGVLAPLDAWNAFEVDWRAMLADEHLPMIRMTDLARNREGSPFEDKRAWTTTRREALVRRCIGIANQHIRPRGVYLGTWLGLTAYPQRPLTEDAYVTAFSGVLLQAALDGRQTFGTEQLNLVFAEHPEIPEARLGRYIATWRSSGRYRDATVASPLNVPPLQLADFAAFLIGERFREPEIGPFFDELLPPMRLSVGPIVAP